MNRYATIVVDPPWDYPEGYATMPGNARKWGHATKRKPLPYGSLPVEEIADLPVAELAAPDAFLWLWTTNRYLPFAFTVIQAWGFEYRQTLIWHKTGNPSPLGGTVAPNHAEYLLAAARGNPRLGSDRLPSNIIAAPKPYKHSRKPDCFLDVIERVSPGPRLEMFARRARFGWDYHGDESLETAGVDAA